MSVDHAVNEVASAAASGPNDTRRFTSDKAASAACTPPERFSLLAHQVLSAVHDIVREHKVTQQLQRGGEWMTIWRLVGLYSNLNIFDVRDNERLHEILWNLPLFPNTTMKRAPLAQYPSDIAAE